MPIFTVNNVKLLLTNKDKTKNAVLEYAKDLTLTELLELTTELVDVIIKSIELEKEQKEKEVKVEAVIPAEVKEDVPSELIEPV